MSARCYARGCDFSGSRRVQIAGNKLRTNVTGLVSNWESRAKWVRQGGKMILRPFLIVSSPGFHVRVLEWSRQSTRNFCLCCLARQGCAPVEKGRESRWHYSGVIVRECPSSKNRDKATTRLTTLLGRGSHAHTHMQSQMYIGVSWPVSSRNIEVGIVFMWIWKKRKVQQHLFIIQEVSFFTLLSRTILEVTCDRIDLAKPLMSNWCNPAHVKVHMCWA